MRSPNARQVAKIEFCSQNKENTQEQRKRNRKKPSPDFKIRVALEKWINRRKNWQKESVNDFGVDLSKKAG
jgi:hypothetical protein